MHSRAWDQALNTGDPDIACNNIETIKLGMEKLIPHKEVTVLLTYIPWFTEACRMADKAVCLAYINWSKSPCAVTHDGLRRARQNYQKVEKEAKR